MDLQFQSTRPRGARPLVFDAADKRLCVSIHAPAWGATSATQPISPKAMFQSTRPRGARHDALANLQQHRQVSIHAPAWGATQGGPPVSPRASVFQSTRPRGARPLFALRPVSKPKFQSTRPRGARHGPRWIGERSGGVSIHAPAWGATASSQCVEDNRENN